MDFYINIFYFSSFGLKEAQVVLQSTTGGGLHRPEKLGRSAGDMKKESGNKSNREAPGH